MSTPAGYVHGFHPDEEDRLRRQARTLQPRIARDLPYGSARRLLEIGCGVGAQTELLLERFPELHVTGVDASERNLSAARAHLERLPGADGRWTLVEADATQLELQGMFDAAHLCWVLEHVDDPGAVLDGARRALTAGAPIVVTEVHNDSFHLWPAAPATSAYWEALNQHQVELGGDPNVGARLGNLLLAAGFQDIRVEVNPILLDDRHPQERASFMTYWSELLLSGAAGLLEAGRIEPGAEAAVREELARLGRQPGAVFQYSFVQARARLD